MLEFNNYYIKEQENLTGLFANIFVIIEDIYKKKKSHPMGETFILIQKHQYKVDNTYQL